MLYHVNLKDENGNNVYRYMEYPEDIPDDEVYLLYKYVEKSLTVIENNYTVESVYKVAEWEKHKTYNAHNMLLKFGE